MFAFVLHMSVLAFILTHYSQVEECDMMANIHGKWMRDKVKSRLHMFMKTKKISADYKYEAIGPDHNRYAYLNLFCFYNQFLLKLVVLIYSKGDVTVMVVLCGYLS